MTGNFRCTTIKVSVPFTFSVDLFSYTSEMILVPLNDYSKYKVSPPFRGV